MGKRKTVPRAFANAGRGKAGCAQGLWRGSHGFACSKAVYAMTVTILTVRVAVLAGQYAGALTAHEGDVQKA